ncbi:hypothetical protein LSH36_987g00029 [Paralvinella palmiformis]|uniref:Uncharacterized protein n=1 Tax=Paralvinella palmiformis TaxID=53620 RepID=A0AAD9IWI6_9ANNE|nr:hypothetical protein LSH36_987g00029 [Paralvinella palmiformis]
MVSILLCFTRAQRDGSWDLHLYAFKRMPPILFRYDHVNYARWGTVYLAEMSVLPPEVLLEFQEGITRIVSYNLRTVIASQTTAILRLTTDDEEDEYTHTMSTRKVGWKKTTLMKAA